MERTVHVFSNGSFHRKGNTLYFQGDKGKRYLPVESVREIVVHGEVDFNKRFLEFLSQKEIILHYFNHYGYYMGSFHPREHYNSGYMTLHQAEYYLDEGKRFLVARAFVQGAAANILRVLRYYLHRGKDVTQYIGEIEILEKRTDLVGNIAELMAIEGNIRERYYHGFDIILAGTGFVFEKRSRRPPTNQLNALVSFGNSLMYTSVLGEIYKTHLDPRLGYLHSSNQRRFSLNLDVAEVFKPIIVDRVIFTLIGKHVITLEDFDKKQGGLIMSEKARKEFVEAYDERLRAVIKHRQSKRPVSYRRLIRMELYKLEKHFMGETDYKPFIAQW